MALTITAFTDSDRASLLDFWGKVLPLDAITEDTLDERILLDDNFDPETFLLAREGKELAGFILGSYGKRSDLGDADPTKTRSWITAFGIGPERPTDQVAKPLLTRAEQFFKSKGKTEVMVSTYPPGYFTPGVDGKAYPHLLEFYTANGYQEIRQAISMDASIVLFALSDEVRSKEKKIREKGIDIRPFRRGDLLGFLNFLERSMPTDWVRVERANLRALTRGQFHSDQITVVTKGDEIIGYCQFEGSHFGPFGVSDAYQGQGVGTVLLARTLERMRTMGHHDAWVMWTDDVAAKVYQKFGFKETRRFSILKKRL
jgi:mycothiol synthase